VADPRVDAKAVAPAGYDLPLSWIPMTFDNSSSGGVWQQDNGKWGPFGGHLLHMSFGTSSLFAVMTEPVSGVAGAGAASAFQNPGFQSAIVKFPLRFESGLMRGRFNPADGQLYVVGMKGWQTNAAKDGCFQRVRYTGKTVAMPAAIHIAKDTIQLTFPSPLDRASVEDSQAYSVEQWNYEWWSTYGSPDLSPSQPGKKGRDQLDVSQAVLSADGKVLTLSVPNLRNTMETLVKSTLKLADGTEAKLELAATIYSIPPEPAQAAQ
jgi:hypothetical protein